MKDSFSRQFSFLPPSSFCRVSFQQLEYFSNNKPHFSSAHDITSKQVLAPKRGKKKYQHFFYSVNRLNQRKSPSALLVSKEIESRILIVRRRRRRFSKSRERFPKLRTLV